MVSDTILNYIENYLTNLRVNQNRSPETIRSYRYEIPYIFNFLDRIFVLNGGLWDKSSPNQRETYLRNAEIRFNDIKKYKKNNWVKIPSNVRKKLNNRNYITEIDLIHITELRRILLDEVGNSQVSISRKLSSLSSFFKFLKRHKYIKSNIMEDVDRPSLEQKKLIVPKLDDVLKLFEQIEKRTYRNDFEEKLYLLFFHLTFITMARIGEVPKIKVKDVDFDSKRILIHGKGNKQREVLLGNKILNMIQEMIQLAELKKNDYLIRNKDNKPITARALQERVKTILDEAGLEGWMTAHKILRKSPAQALKKYGVDIIDLQALLGHEDPKTTIRYVKDDLDTLSKQFKEEHPLEKLGS